MDEIVHVRPYNKKEHFGWESLVTKTKYVQGIEPVTIKIPVPKLLDVDEILHENDEKIHHEEEPTDMDIDLLHYVPIDSLSPQSLKQQILTVIFHNFKPIKDKFIERIFNSITTEYQWSQIRYMDLVNVFVRLEKLVDLKAFVSNVDLFAGLSDQILFNLHEVDLDQVPEKDIDKLEISSTVTSVLNHSSSYASKKSNLDASDYYQSYKIDANELIEVPNLMKETIIKELIRFRSRMLILEQEKREKELSEERVKSKHLLNELFNKNLNVSQEQQHHIPEPAEIMPEMDDEQYEQYLKSLESSKAETRYKNKLQQLGTLRAKRLNLIEKKRRLKNYESDLIENKFKYIDDLKLQDTSLYSYADYLRQRSKEKQREEELDAIDRQQEKEVSVGALEAPQNIVESHSSSSWVIPDVSGLNDDHKQQVRAKVGELVEKYIGIKEEELVEFIYEGVVDKSISLEELSETFDNDAVSLMNDLHEFVESKLV